jgi:hypothetical protein
MEALRVLVIAAEADDHEHVASLRERRRGQRECDHGTRHA